MSRVSREKKEKAAKAAKTAKQPKSEETAAKPKQGGTVPNEGKCCTCKSYKRVNGCTLPCTKTKKYTPRKATCPDYKLR